MIICVSIFIVLVLTVIIVLNHPAFGSHVWLPAFFRPVPSAESLAVGFIHARRTLYGLYRRWQRLRCPFLGNRQTVPAYRPCHLRKRAIQRRLAVYPYDARTASGRDSRAGCGQSPSGAQQQIFTLPSRMGRAGPPHRTGSNKGQQPAYYTWYHRQPYNLLK